MASILRPQQYPIAEQPAPPAPLRRPGSIRRTTIIDTEWVDGEGSDAVMTGSARDLYTPLEGAARELAAASFRIVASPRRQIMSLEADPPHPRMGELIGVRAGGASRMALEASMGDIVGTPLYQILDDFAGASLVAGWIWPHRAEDKHAYQRQMTSAAPMGKGPTTDICIGFAAGSSGLTPEGAINIIDQVHTHSGPLVNPLDPEGWHGHPDQDGAKMRRARRIDVWREGDLLKVDAGFQDSGIGTDGTRTSVHEYRVHMEVDAATGVVVALHAVPHVLPLPECPGSVVKATRMVGKNLGEFRATVIQMLAGALGCTHLNDVLRSMADVPWLADRLPD